MKSRMALRLAVLLVASQAYGQQIWQTLVVEEKPATPVALATRDLQRYLAQAGGSLPRQITAAQWKAAPVPAVFLVLTPEAGLSPEQKQSYTLRYLQQQGVRVLAIEARDPSGLVHGVYGLLRELGFGFFLGSETVPEALPPALGFETLTRTPAQRIRGVLPWYNFFNSPTTWDPVDHRAFVDQLVRSGANFVGFHTYDAEPFAGFVENKRVVLGARLVNTSKPCWGTLPTPTQKFAFGTDKIYAQEFFGAATSELQEPPATVVLKEQAILSDALQYAHARGLQTCLGFELHKNPLDPVEAEVFLKRLNHLLDAYPSLDYLWLWQPETWGASGFEEAAKGPATTALQNYAIDRREMFQRLLQDKTRGEAPFFKTHEQGKLNRAMEGARLEQYGLLAYRAMKKRTRAPRLVLSGWGGDRRILSAEYYEGLDKLLPKDVVFSSLDLIGPARRVDAIYNELPADRERWPIPWLENDGDQWMTQPYVDIYQDLMGVLQRGGSQGVLGIHWRTRCVEENFQFLVDAAWQPGLRAEAFFQSLARRRYAPAIAPQMAKIHLQLDRLPYRWIGGRGQVECGTFDWGAVGPQGVADELRALRQQAAALLPQAAYSQRQLSWLIAHLDYALAWRDAQGQVLEAEKHLQANRFAEALAALDRPALAQAMRHYAGQITTRGEYGVLATINAKAIASWRRLRAKAMAGLGSQTPEPFGNWKPEPGIMLPRLIGSVAQNQPLSLEPVVLGGAPGWLHYRTVGTKNPWQTLSLKPLRGWVCQVEVPATALEVPGVELAFSLSSKPDAPFAYGPLSVTVMPAPEAVSPNLPLAASTSKVAGLEVVATQRLPLKLRWTDLPGADWYRIYRDGKLLCTTATADFPDLPDQATSRYQVEAVIDGRSTGLSDPVMGTVADIRITETPAIKVLQTSNAGVLLEIGKVTSPHAVQYRLYRQGQANEAVGGSENKIFEHLQGSQKNAPDQEVFLKEGKTSPAGSSFCLDAPPPGKWTYRAVLLNLFGKESEQSARVETEYRLREPRVLLDWPLTALPAGAQSHGKLDFGPEGLGIQEGYLSLAHSEFLHLRQAMTVAFSFQVTESTPMPVILGHGAYNGDGWFFQILGNHLQCRIPGVELAGPAVKVGTWYDVVLVYDGYGAHLGVNGQWVAHEAVPRPVPEVARALELGQYIHKGPEYQFKGRIKNLRIEDNARPVR